MAEKYDGSIVIGVNVDGDSVQAAVKDADSLKEKLVKKLNTVSSTVRDIGAELAKLGATGSAAAAMSVKTFAGFEDSMLKVSSVTGMTGDRLDALTEKAKNMGKTTKFHASEAADAMYYMGLAGWDDTQILDGLDGVMMLSAASGADLATASDIVTDALTALGYTAADSGRLVDVMAAASANSNTGVELMGATFKYVAPLAGALGISMEDLAIATGLMANAGIKGTQAGTSLRSILQRLSTNTSGCWTEMHQLGIQIMENDGSMRDWRDIMIDLREKFAYLSEEEQINIAKTVAGQEAMSGFLAIVNSGDGDFNKLTKAIDNSNGVAANMAKTMEKGVGGSMRELSSMVESLAIETGQALAPAMTELLDTIKPILDNVIEFVKENPKLISTILGASVAVAAVGAALVTVATLISSVTTLIGGLNTVMIVLLTNPVVFTIAAVVAGVGLLVVALKELYDHCEWVRDKVHALGEALGLIHPINEETIEQTKQQANEYQNAKTQLEALTQAQQKSHDSAIESLGTKFQEIQQGEMYLSTLKGMIDANGKVKEGYDEVVKTVSEEINKIFPNAIRLRQTNNGLIVNQKKNLDELIESMKREAIMAALKENYTEAIKNRQEQMSLLADLRYEQNKLAQSHAELKAQFDQADYGSGQWNALKQQLIEVEDAYDDITAARDEAYDSLEKSARDISAFENYSTVMTTGSEKQINDMMIHLTKGIQTTKDGMIDIGLYTYDQLAAMYEEHIEQVNRGFTESDAEWEGQMVDAMNRRLEMERNNLVQGGEQNEEILKQHAKNQGEILFDNLYDMEVMETKSNGKKKEIAVTYNDWEERERQAQAEKDQAIEAGHNAAMETLNQISKDQITADTKKGMEDYSNEMSKGGENAEKNFKEEGLDRIERDVSETNDKAPGWGEKLVMGWAESIVDFLTNGAFSMIKSALNQITKLFESHSPPKVGPLKYIDIWGENVGAVWAESFAGGISDELEGVSSQLKRETQSLLASTQFSTLTGMGLSTGNTAYNQSNVFNFNVPSVSPYEIESAMRQAQYVR